MKRTLSRLVLGAALFAATASAQRLAISQVRAEAGSFTVFLDAVSEDGRTPLPVTAIKASYGKQNLTVASLAPFSEGVAYIVLVDVSKSLGPGEFAQVHESLLAFTEGLRPIDRMAVIRFGDDARIVSDFTGDKESLKAKLAELHPTDSRTSFHLALKQGLELGRRLDPGLPIRRAIVVLTDGKDEGSGVTLEDVLSDARQNRTPIYAIGFSRLPGAERTRYFDLLRRLAMESGGDFFPVHAGGPIAPAYTATKTAIARVYAAKLTGTGGVSDGRAERLQITLTAGDRVLTDGVDVRVLPGPDVPPQKAPMPPKHWYRQLPVWAYYAAGVGFVLMVLVAIIALRGKPVGIPTPPPVPADRPNRPQPLASFDQPPANPPLIRVKLVVLRGQKPGSSFDLAVGSKKTVGHATTSDLALPAELTMSPEHFEFLRAGGRLAIRDLGAGKGTSINGIPIRNVYPVSDGDTITAGATVIRVVAQ
jgi:VWFA-related protein